ncbi:MAG: alpha-ketoglutarate-dependent dioxygenase AlkB [Granulosicoccus sp.]
MDDLLSQVVEICPGVYVLPRFADSNLLVAPLNRVLEHSPLRQMQTRRGYLMSVHTSNCGEVGWISDRKGYRYSQLDPLSGEPWHVMPEAFATLASRAATAAGFPGFSPDACLINHYQPGTQMGAHQDRDESDFSQPIVSVSLGIDARFFVIGPEKRGKSIPIDLSDGDVVVFGGTARRFFHGVRKLKESTHSQFGAVRWNLTFRKAL